MPYSSFYKIAKLWHAIPWLPGYLVYKHDNGNHSLRANLLNNRMRTSNDIVIIETAKFTIIQEGDNQILVKSQKSKDFFITTQDFPEKLQAKLIYELEDKHTNHTDLFSTNIQKMLDGIKKLQSYKDKRDELFLKYKSEEISPKKKLKDQHTDKILPHPFQYFNNSGNYIKEIETILAVSDSFKNAKRIKDVFCGNGELTFYLAQKNPDKHFIASAMNAEMMAMLNVIKETNFDLFKKQYKAYHDRLFQSPNTQVIFYIDMVKEFNTQVDKDYILLIFLQHYSYSKVHFTNNGIESEFKMNKGASAEYWLKQIRTCKEILEIGNITFVVSDMKKIIDEFLPGDFYFMITPSENDDPRSNQMNINALISSVLQLNRSNIPCLLTYANLDNLLTKSGLDAFFYLPFSTRSLARRLKVLSIGISSCVLDAESKNQLKIQFKERAEKNFKKTNKQFAELATSQLDKQDKENELLTESMNNLIERGKLLNEVLVHQDAHLETYSHQGSSLEDLLLASQLIAQVESEQVGVIEEPVIQATALLAQPVSSIVPAPSVVLPITPVPQIVAMQAQEEIMSENVALPSDPRIIAQLNNLELCIRHSFFNMEYAVNAALGAVNNRLSHLEARLQRLEDNNQHGDKRQKIG